MVVVPAGAFLMGSDASEPGRAQDEGPQRRVTIAKPFAAGRFEVTRDQFAAFVRETGRAVADSCSDFDPIRNLPVPKKGWSFQRPGFVQQGDHPAVCVSWRDAKDFVAWLSSSLARDYRLLSEAEWEYAARAGSSGRYHFGDSESRLCEFGNVSSRGDLSLLLNRPPVDCTDGHKRTAPVGKFAPNAFGLHDTIGNVWEWVEDCFQSSYAGAPTNGAAWQPAGCRRRVVRGGGWGSIGANHRSAARNGRFSDDGRFYFIGFRVARTLAGGS